jgi:hypothetical protein
MMEAVEPLAEQLRRRAFECRLTPDWALETLAEAEAFLQDRGLFDPHRGLRAVELVRGVP